MKQEYWLATAIGLVVLAYILDSVVNPLAAALPTPYHYFIPEYLTTYPFTTTSIIIKAVAVFIGVTLALSFTGFAKTVKGIALFVVSVLLQLYSLQDIASGAHVIPVEWAISFTLAGLALFLLAIIFLFLGLVSGAGSAMTAGDEDFKL